MLSAGRISCPCQCSLSCVAVAVVAAGGLGGMLYWLAIFPVDVIKSAMQTDSIVKAERKYPDMLTTAQVRTVAILTLWQALVHAVGGVSTRCD